MNSLVKFKKDPVRLVDGRPLFISDTEFSGLHSDLHTGFINRLKTALKKIPQLYAFIFYFLAPAFFLGKQPKSIFQYAGGGKLIIDIGSGNRRLGPNVVNVDIHPWEQVDILADAHDLPFADNSVDGLVFSWVLEHMKDPIKVASEFRRVLKSGGYLYLSTNFIFPYHPSPRDYYRWTSEGLRELFSDLEIVELKPTIGPMAAFLSVFQEWASLILSFNSQWLKDFLWILLVVTTSPLKLLDLLFIHYKFAENISAGFYLIARKPRT